MDWQPIKTAPRQHLARFLVFAKPRSSDEATVFEVTHYSDCWGEGFRLNFGYATPAERDILARVTHWMPLPAAPHTLAKEALS